MKLRKLEDFAQGIAPAWSNLHIIPRGLPRFIDQNLRGDVRFAKKQGNFLPVTVAENLVTLRADAAAGSRELLVDRLFTDLTAPDNMISIGRVEKQVVSDVDLEDGRIILDEPLAANHAAGSEILLYAVPVSVIGPRSAGDNVVQIRTSFNVNNGDYLVLQAVPSLLRSAVDYKVIQSRFLGTSGLLLNYEVTLQESIPKDLATDEEVFFRAHPGYTSQTITLPAGAETFGPFVIDFISGPLVSEQNIEESFSIQLYNGVGQPLTGFEDPLTIAKNYPVVQVPVNSESLLFWDLLKGELQYNSARKTLLVCDDNGEFALSTQIVPAFPPGTEWEIPVRCTNNALFRTKIDPDGYTDTSLIANINARPLITLSNSSSPGTRIEIVVKSTPGAIVELDNWQPTANTAVSLSYNIVSTAQGSFRWQSTGILIKPYFLNTTAIRGRFDFTNFDSGTVML